MKLIAVLALVALTGCETISNYGVIAAEKRRQMNDAQARATTAAICDVSIGAYWREWNAAERAFADLVCGQPGMPQIGRQAPVLPPALRAPGVRTPSPAPAGRPA